MNNQTLSQAALIELDEYISDIIGLRHFGTSREFTESCVQALESDKCPKLLTYLLSTHPNRNVVILADRINTDKFRDLCAESFYVRYKGRGGIMALWSKSTIDRGLRYALQARKAK